MAAIASRIGAAANSGPLLLRAWRLVLGVAIMGAGGCAAQAAGDDPAPLVCAAQGAETLAPAMSDSAACDAFAAALDAALAEAGGSPAAREGLRATLTFSRNGVARAEIRRAGESERWFDANVAISDRPLDHSAIERLAAQVAHRLHER